jgi:hypothetical protein
MCAALHAARALNAMLAPHAAFHAASGGTRRHVCALPSARRQPDGGNSRRQQSSRSMQQASPAGAACSGNLHTTEGSAYRTHAWTWDLRETQISS